MTLTRSGPSLDGLLEALDAWASGQVQHDVAVSLAQAGQGLVRRGFDQSKAPDGSTWAPLKDPKARGRRRAAWSLDCGTIIRAQPRRHTYCARGMGSDPSPDVIARAGARHGVRPSTSTRG